MMADELGRQDAWGQTHDGQERPVWLSTNTGDYQIALESQSRRELLRIPLQQILPELATLLLQTVQQIQCVEQVTLARTQGRTVSRTQDPRLYSPASGSSPALPRPTIYPMKASTQCHPPPRNEPPSHTAFIQHSCDFMITVISFWQNLAQNTWSAYIHDSDQLKTPGLHIFMSLINSIRLTSINSIMTVLTSYKCHETHIFAYEDLLAGWRQSNLYLDIHTAPWDVESSQIPWGIVGGRWWIYAQAPQRYRNFSNDIRASKRRDSAGNINQIKIHSTQLTHWRSIWIGHFAKMQSSVPSLKSWLIVHPNQDLWQMTSHLRKKQ